MYRMFYIILGFILASVGLSYIVIYLNLFAMGYSFREYIAYIMKRYECIFFFVGYVMLLLSLIIKKERKYGIRL